VEVAIVFLGPEDPPKTIRLIGKELKYLNPDERSTGALIRNALIKISEHKLNQKEPEPLIKNQEHYTNNVELLNGEIESSPGIYISDSSFESIIKYYSERSTIIQLHENGTDISGIEIPEDAKDCTFILSDDKDFTDEEEDIIKKHSYRSISISPIILHTDHCIILIHNHLDRITK
jgi:tRNA (pseudouridine54-N1)-methyltransferase